MTVWIYVDVIKEGQSAEKLKLLSELERSARAEVKLWLKALAYARSQSG
jgi:hypothetical protein